MNLNRVIEIARQELLLFSRSAGVFRMYFLQIAIVSLISFSVHWKMRALGELNPSIVLETASRQLTTIPLTVAFFSVAHGFSASVAKVRTGNFLDTLMAGPLLLRELVTGKAMGITMIATAGGLLFWLLSALAIVVCYGMPLAMQISPLSIVFALITLPLLMFGLSSITLGAMFVAKETQFIVFAINMGCFFALWGSSAISFARPNVVLSILIFISFLFSVGCDRWLKSVHPERAVLMQD